MKEREFDYQITILAIRLWIEGVEGFSLKLEQTDDATEALNMENLVHRTASASFSDNLLVAASANTFTQTK